METSTVPCRAMIPAGPRSGRCLPARRRSCCGCRWCLLHRRAARAAWWMPTPVAFRLASPARSVPLRRTRTRFSQHPVRTQTILFQLALAQRVAHTHRPVRPFEPLADLLRPRPRIPYYGTRADEAPEVDDDRLDAGCLPGKHPKDVAVPLQLQHHVEQVDVLLRKGLCCRGLRILLREDGQVIDMAGRDGVEGDTLAQVDSMVQDLRYQSSTVAASPSAGRSLVSSSQWSGSSVPTPRRTAGWRHAPTSASGKTPNGRFGSRRTWPSSFSVPSTAGLAMSSTICGTLSSGGIRASSPWCTTR